MKVVDLHPEDLLDKLSAGSLSVAERERLDAHLAQCDACRFELSVREDFEQDAPVIERRPQLSFPSHTAEHARPLAARVTPSMRARSRRRWPLAMLAAALLLCAGGATAAVVTGAVPAPWPWAQGTKAGTSEQRGSESAAVPKSERKRKHVAPTPSAVGDPGTALAGEASPVSEAPSAASAVEPAALPTPPLVTSAPRVVDVWRGEPAARAASPAALPTSASFATLAAAPSPTPSDEEASPQVDPAGALFADANRARRDGNADRAVTLYRALQSRYPGSSESQLSRALLAQLLLDRGSPEAALAGFDRYLAEGTPVLSAEALVGRARALEQLGKPTEAAAAWREVQNRFAGSVHARLAATRLAALGTR